MKKLILSIISLAFVASFTLEASSKVEVVTNSTVSNKMIVKKKKISVQECKEYLGAENFKFINDVYNNQDVAMLKCEQEMKK